MAVATAECRLTPKCITALSWNYCAWAMSAKACAMSWVAVVSRSSGEFEDGEGQVMSRADFVGSFRVTLSHPLI